MTLFKMRRVLLAKIESSTGTAESLTVSDGAFNAYDIQIDPSIGRQKREAQGGFGNLASIPEGYMGRVKFKTDVGWDGTSTEPTWADTFLPACAYVKTGGNVFSPKTESPTASGAVVKTLTIGVNEDGLYKYLRGAMGNFKIIGPTGKMITIEWDFLGVWTIPTDVTQPTPTYPTALPLRASGAISWNSEAFCAGQVTFDAGNEVILRECTNAADNSGYAGAIIVNRNPQVTVDPEAKLVATSARYTKHIDNSEHALSWTIKGPTNATLILAAPKAQIVDIKEGDRNKLQTDDITLQLNRNGSTVDSECTLTFTPAS